jgi:SAM-dependent methyltransferase
MELNSAPETWGQNSPAALADELARRYGLSSPLPCTRLVALLREAAASDDALPDYLYPWHWPVVDLLQDKPRFWRILDVGCGIPLLLHYLARAGFTALFGTEDSHAQPGAVEAAREFCARSQINAVIVDATGGDIGGFLKVFGAPRFDIMTHFNATPTPDFALSAALLREGGLFVSEASLALSAHPFARHFETLEVFPDLGFRLLQDNGAVCIYRKRLPPTRASHSHRPLAA